MCKESYDNKGTGLTGFTIGAIIGATAGFFVNTKKGKKVVKDAWKKIEPYIEDAKNEVEDIRLEAGEKVEEAVDQIKDFTRETKERLPVKFKVPPKKTFFKGL